MRHLVQRLARLGGVLALGLAWCPPALAQWPAPACDPATWPATGVPDPVVLNWCADNPGSPCDLGIVSWNPPADLRSPEIRIGDAISAAPERPRFFFDEANNRFYTKLYSQLRNSSLGLAPVGRVSVDFFYKEGDTPADPTDPAGWLPAGTLIGATQHSSYGLNIPGTNLGPGMIHTQSQDTPVCWSLTAGALPPRKFTLKAVVNWSNPSVPTNNDDDNLANNTAFSFYDLTALARRVQLGLAIDLSGSMAGSKLTQALNKALLFSHLIEQGDQLGVYGFATDIPPAERDSFTATYTPVGGGSQTLSMSDVKQIFPMQTITGTPAQLTDLAQILTQSAYNCTPVGQGLLRARKGLGEVAAPPGAAKAIVLFSDGLQNVAPFVHSAPAALCGAPSPLPLIDADATFHAENIQIYSIYWGPSSGYGYESMWQIQQQTAGDFFLSTDSELGLASAYYALRGLVDDMIFFQERGSTSAASPAEFEVAFDAGVDLATVAVAWPTGETRLRLDCRKKGEGTWANCAGQTEALPSFQVFRFRPGPETTWEFRVHQVVPRTGATDYTAAVFSAVQEATLTPSLDTRGFEAGRPLPIHAGLTSGGGALAGADVRATVRVPTRAFGNTLRRYAGRLQNTPAGDNRANAMMAQLQTLLLQDEGSDQIYTYRDATVSLRDDGRGADRVANDGIYSGELPASETQVAGDYQVIIDAAATLPSGRALRRLAKLSAICNVAAPDPRRTVVRSAFHPERGADVQLATLSIQWADRFANAAFPGTASQIAITPIDARLQGPLVDNLDSTFSQVVAFASGSQPAIQVAIRGVPQGRFPVAGSLPYRREASLHLGLAEPHGTFGNAFSSGPSVGLDAALRLDPNLAVRTELVRDDFAARAGGSKALVNLSAYLQYLWPGHPWEPYFEAGIGAYDLEGLGTAGGFAVGAGAQRRLTPRWDLDLNVQGHRVGGSLDLVYSRLRAGLIYKF